MTVYGWDASDFDWERGPVDLAAARAAGVDFFTHKATEGTRVTHKRFGEALRRARDAGVPVLGAYGVPRTPGNGSHGSDAAQVDYFLSYVDREVPWWRTWPRWMWQVDLEHWPYDKVAPSHGLAWCERLAALTQRRVVLYAPQWAYGNSIGGTWPLWASGYGGNPVAAFRQAYPGDTSPRWAAYSGRPPTILQYGSRTVIGRQNTCDANAFRGTLQQLLDFVGGPATEGTTSTPTPSTEEDEVQEYTIAQAADGRLFVCNGMTSRPVTAAELNDFVWLGKNEGRWRIRWDAKGEGVPRGGWHPGAFGAVIQPASAALTDEQVAAQADRIVAALLAASAGAGLSEDRIVAAVKRALREGVTAS